MIGINDAENHLAAAIVGDDASFSGHDSGLAYHSCIVMSDIRKY